MGSDPLVTIVTITFNLIKAGREKTFRQCVESVHSQTYKNIEHIIIDGASTDGTIDLIKEYFDKGWIIYISEPDSGIYDAMNKGIKNAKGKYLAFLNSDDFYHDKNGIKVSIGLLEKTGADYSFGNIRQINHIDESVIGYWRGNINLIPFGIHYCHQSMLIKLKLIKELGGFDSSYRISADSDLMIKLFSLSRKYIHIPFCFVSYRSGGLSCENSLQCRIDHSTSFYNHMGKDNGLSFEDCYFIWNFSIFSEKNIISCIRLANKIKEKEWVKEFIYHYLIYFILHKIFSYKYYRIIKLAFFSPKFFIKKSFLKIRDKLSPNV